MTGTCIKTDLFEARVGGYRVYRIPGIVIAAKGTVVAYCEARSGAGGDWDPIDICMRRSLDGGITWEPARVVVDHATFGGESPVNNFVCIADRVTGDLHALFCHDYARVFHMVSNDDGATFSEPREITSTFDAFRVAYPWAVVAVGPGHAIQASSGRLVVPVWLSDGTGTEFGPGKRGHRPSEVAVVYSDDHGATWLDGDFVVRNEERFRNPSESCVVELADGRVLLNTRTESHTHRRVVSSSANGATDWSEPVFDDALVEPICCAGIVNTGAGIVFTNPGVLERTMRGGPGERGIGAEATGRIFDRKRLTARLSIDDCASWTASRVVETGPSGYSDLTALGDGTVLCFYECGIVDRMFDDRFLRVARFDVEWIRAAPTPAP